MTAPAETDTLRERLRYRVLVLGPLGLERDGQRIEAGRWQPRVQTLFLLLMTARDRQRRRDDLMDLLWPDADPETSAGNLRILLHRLRLALGGEPSPVLSDHGWIRLNPAYAWELDLEEMDRIVSESNGDPAQLRAAAALYRGEPLVEHRYDDWAMPVLEQARRVWRHACMQLAIIHGGRSEYEEAVAWYRRLLEVDPLDEEAVRGLLGALANAGKPGEALRQYERFRETLAAELDAPPEAETVALAERLKIQLTDGAARPLERPPLGSVLSAPPDLPLIDRQDELERALLAGDAVEAGIGRMLLLSGEAGVGKTRLGQDVMLRMQERGFLVTAARCFERDQTVPFAPLLDLLASVYALVPPSLRTDVPRRWPQLAWLLPTGTAPTEEDIPEEPDQQRLLFRACAGFLAAAATERPLALLLDDLHWADEGSLDLLRYLAAQMRGVRLLFIGAYRDADISREHPLQKTVRDLMRDGLVERIAISRLGPDETAQLVAAGLGGARPPDDFVEFAYRRTKGNPFYVRRLVEALGGRYRLVRQIAAGGMGRVFEAEDTATGDRVAVKIMFARTEADPRALLRFRQEGVVLASLSHPNIVRVHATVVEEHASCIVMDLVEGRSLADVLREEDVSLARARSFTRQVARALAQAHERGIVHRDIKPSNIMIGADDHVTVTDFGIARLVRPAPQTTTTFATTSTGITLGTPLYMAPEQIQGQRVDARTDIYSLGALLYHLVTGGPPFTGEDAVTIAYKHVHESPVHPRALRPDLPQAWEDVVLRALAKSPDDRFQSAVAMEQAISVLEAPESTESEEEPASEPSDETSRTGRRAAAPAGGPSAVAASSRSWPLRLAGVVAALAVVGVVGAILIGRIVNSGTHFAIPGQFNGPTGLATDGVGNIYAADEWNGRLQEISSAGIPLRQWGDAAGVRTPSDVALDPTTGALFVSDLGHKDIVRLQIGQKPEYIGMNAGALAVGPNGALFATDYARYIVCVFHPRGSRTSGWNVPQVEFVSHPGSALDTCAVPSNNHGVSVSTIPLVLPAPCGDSRLVRVGAFDWPAGIATDQEGRLYVADRLHNQIARFTNQGTPLPPIGTCGRAQGEFDAPSDVAVDQDGNIFVADTGKNRVQELKPDGKRIHAWNLRGSAVGKLDHPVSVEVDWKGDIYVSDYGNNRVLQLSPLGEPAWSSNGARPIVFR